MPGLAHAMGFQLAEASAVLKELPDAKLLIPDHEHATVEPRGVECVPVGGCEIVDVDIGRDDAQPRCRFFKPHDESSMSGYAA